MTSYINTENIGDIGVKWVSESDVPADTRALAREMLDYCVRELNLRAVEALWYRGGSAVLSRLGWTPNRALGLCESGADRMAVAVDVSDDDLLWAVAHESRHLYQAQSDEHFPYYCNGAEALARYERDAEDYAALAVSRFREAQAQKNLSKGFGSFAMARACMRRGW